MALKFLNKKGWHTGSLRNIENVWKAEQKHGAEQKKLEEFKKQIEEERERFEFRLLQEQAGLVPKQERLEFLYDSGLAVGKSSSDGFKALETPKTETQSDVAKPQDVPGALFQDKPQSANDAWRKLHSDPLLMIRQREQEALAKIKNNPIRMEMIRKSIEGKKKHEGKHKKKEHRKHRKKTKHEKQSQSDTESASSSEEERRERKRPEGRPPRPDSSRGSENHRARTDRTSRHDTPTRPSVEEKVARQREASRDDELHGRHRSKTMHGKETRLDLESALSSEEEKRERKHLDGRPPRPDSRRGSENCHPQADPPPFRRAPPDKDQTTRRLSAEEKAARLREMQLDAEVHEEQRYKRLKKASEDDAREASRGSTSSGRNFLDAAHRSIYGTEKGGSSSIEESVRRRKHYSQGGSEARDGNAFRR